MDSIHGCLEVWIYLDLSSLFNCLSAVKTYLMPRSFLRKSRGCPRGVMVKAMDCRIVVSEFEFQSRYYVHIRANTLGKGMNPLILKLWVK